jgi:hypothetical protein
VFGEVEHVGIEDRALDGSASGSIGSGGVAGDDLWHAAGDVVVAQQGDEFLMQRLGEWLGGDGDLKPPAVAASADGIEEFEK